MLVSALAAWLAVPREPRPSGPPPSPGYPLGGLAMALVVVIVVVLALRWLLRAADRHRHVPEPDLAPRAGLRGALTRTDNKPRRPRRQRRRRG